ncbi:uncharacterized protein FSUBG_12506, partial [Fusarium subglutinans]
DGYYVKLHSDQIGKLYTPAPHIEEVYISQLVINYFSEVNLMDPDHPIPEFNHLFPSNAPDRKCFWVRNERGRPFQLTVEKEYGLENDARAARYKKAARSIESAGGWNRCINPAIQLFIVPCPGVKIDFLYHCINAAKVKRTTRQDVTLISSEKLDEMTNGVALHWWLHRAAFSWGGLNGDYHTSQVPENLIFGTSEYNSLMTRYEKYFQDYVRRCACTNKRYTFKLDTEIHRHPFANSELPFWLCYVMSYQFDVIEANEVVETYSDDFHPFRRGFFTWFEQDLDTAILDRSFGEWPVHIAEEYD